MRLEKKDWISPRTGFQEFVPQEFIAACAPDEYYRVYKFWCNFNAGRYVWIETNGAAGLQSSGNWVSNASQYAPGGPLDQTWASNRYNWGTFSPCNTYHEVRVKCNAEGNIIDGTDIKAIFPDGYVNTRTSARGAQPCVVWTNGGTNTHVTQSLDVDKYSVHSPS